MSGYSKKAVQGKEKLQIQTMQVEDLGLIFMPLFAAH
jgi:hypothetical protein